MKSLKRFSEEFEWDEVLKQNRKEGDQDKWSLLEKDLMEVVDKHSGEFGNDSYGVVDAMYQVMDGMFQKKESKVEKMEKPLKAEKIKKEKDLELGFDINSFEKGEDTDTTGFRSEFEPIAKGEEKKLKKEIQITTPGLNKSIKKFEDFKISISIDKVEPEEEMSNIDVEDCENCTDCEFNPCECEVDNTESKEGCGCCDECTGQLGCECCEQCSCVQMGEQPMDQPKVMNITDFISSIIGQR